MNIIRATLESGEDVLISGFGKFQIREKKARKGRNPATGEDMILSARKVVSFKCSDKLKDLINKKCMENRMDRDQLIFNALKRAGYHYAVTLPCGILKCLIHRVEESPEIIRVPLARSDHRAAI
jgi:hypothetical protein